MQSDQLEKMLASGQDSSMLRYTLGTLSLKKGLFEQAATHFEAGLAQEMKHSASWKGYAKALMELKRFDEARQAYETGIKVAEELGDIQAIKEMQVFLKRLDKM